MSKPNTGVDEFLSLLTQLREAQDALTQRGDAVAALRTSMHSCLLRIEDCAGRQEDSSLLQDELDRLVKQAQQLLWREWLANEYFQRSYQPPQPEEPPVVGPENRISLESLGLHTRTFYALSRSGLLWVDQVVNLSIAGLLQTRNFGLKGACELVRALKLKGLLEGTILLESLKFLASDEGEAPVGRKTHQGLVLILTEAGLIPNQK